MHDDDVQNHDTQAPVGTLQLGELAARTRDLRHLGQLLQTLPKVTFRLTEIEPQNEDLVHIARHHGFPDWPLLQKPNAYTRFTDEVILRLLVEAFNTYLADILIATATGSRASNRWDLARLIDGVAASGGLPGLVAYVTEVGLGEERSMSGGGYDYAVEAIEVRNLILFNKGIVDEKFGAVFRGSGVRVNELYPLETPQALVWIDAILDVAEFIDSGFVEHFKLPVSHIFRSDDVLPS